MLHCSLGVTGEASTVRILIPEGASLLALHQLLSRSIRMTKTDCLAVAVQGLQKVEIFRIAEPQPTASRYCATMCSWRHMASRRFQLPRSLGQSVCKWREPYAIMQGSSHILLDPMSQSHISPRSALGTIVKSILNKLPPSRSCRGMRAAAQAGHRVALALIGYHRTPSRISAARTLIGVTLQRRAGTPSHLVTAHGVALSVLQRSFGKALPSR